MGVPDRIRGDLCPVGPLHYTSFTSNRGCPLSRRSRRGPPRGTCESARILLTISWRPLRASTMGRGAQFQKQPRFSLCRRTLANPRRHQKGLTVGVPDRFRGDLCPDDPLHCASFTRNRGCSLSRRSRRGRPEAFARVRGFYSRSRGGPFGPPQWAGVRVSRRHFLCVRAPSTEAGDF